MSRAIVAFSLVGIGATWSPASDEPPEPATTVSIEIVDSPDSEADPRGFLIRLHRNADDKIRPAVLARLTTGGTATPGSDFVAPPPWVALPLGVASVDIHVPVLDDDEAETGETIEFNASVVEGATITAGDAAGDVR